ncbi:MAG: HAMP domain-containing histidine kinase [Ignavibacteriales bacterium]|nr:HAMP domain-containing histidine kinase [Ignavibacteriales bacterium]
MFVASKITYLENPARRTISLIESKSLQISDDATIHQLLECFPDLVLILNEKREIVAYNSKAEEFFQLKEKIAVIGERLGEALGCIHSKETEHGCGSSLFCSECKANSSCKKTIDSLVVVEDECRINITYDGFEASLDFKVITSPLKYGDNNYVIFAIKNLESEKRRELLERIFFHDVLNTASIIFGISGMISEVRETDDFDKYAKILQNTSEQLIQEIQAQRDLSNAEAGKLIIYPAQDTVNDILEKAFELYQNNSLTKGKEFVCKYPKETMIIETDHHFIIRSLGNLIKNALEAISTGGKVELQAYEYGDNIRFVVVNDGVIPKHIQLQIFNRSFSTKAKKGRGIGTYSVKLLIENYLKGKVSFVSNDENQTQFIIEVPKKFPELESY